MFRVLRVEMVRVDISIKELAFEININERSLRNKINGLTSFTWEEILAIRKRVAPQMSLEELFVSEKAG